MSYLHKQITKQINFIFTYDNNPIYLCHHLHFPKKETKKEQGASQGYKDNKWKNQNVNPDLEEFRIFFHHFTRLFLKEKIILVFF